MKKFARRCAGLGMLLSTTLFFQSCGLLGDTTGLDIPSSQALPAPTTTANPSQNSTNGDGVGVNPAPPIAPPVAPPPLTTTLNMPVGTVCIDGPPAGMTAMTGGSNVNDTPALKLGLFNSAGQLVCEVRSSALKSSLMNYQTLADVNLGQECANLKVGSVYRLKLNSAAETGYTHTFIIASSYVQMIQTGTHSAMLSNQPILNSEDDNFPDLGLPPNLPAVAFANIGDVDPSLCSTLGDPLLLDLTDRLNGTDPIELTGPQEGVLFDILGLKSWPQPHFAKTVSWFTPASAAGRFFVALPDASGHVGGIDQLFGNNTQGPDGLTSSDGFAALSKWDANGDGVIDASDPVFARLRFWSDANADGIAQAEELHTAAELGIESISLRYLKGYAEVDAYGDAVKYKSQARTRDGRSHLLMDLWLTFR